MADLETNYIEDDDEFYPWGGDDDEEDDFLDEIDRSMEAYKRKLEDGEI